MCDLMDAKSVSRTCQIQTSPHISRKIKQPKTSRMRDELKVDFDIEPVSRFLFCNGNLNLTADDGNFVQGWELKQTAVKTTPPKEDKFAVSLMKRSRT